jgi:thymidylate synthase ThyX
MDENYEEFSEEQIKTLKRYVTNTTSHVFVLRNLPEVIKGALFSKYSRSVLGLRSLLLKDFIGKEEAAFSAIAGLNKTEEGEEIEDQSQAIEKANRFYKNILDGYGDDSVGELGGAHLALENISMLAAKVIEDSRIGGSPLEKSTRYVYFDQKHRGGYLFYKEQVIMTSAYRHYYLDTCNALFDTYSRLIPPLTEIMERQIPRGENDLEGPYRSSIRCKVLDCLRGLLPASTLTNMGIYGNGRFFEGLIQKLHGHNFSELQNLGKKVHQELSKEIPSFVTRSALGHKHQKGFCSFKEQMEAELKTLSEKHSVLLQKMRTPGIKLTSYDPDSLYQVAAALLFDHSNVSLLELQEYCRKLPKEELEAILDGACHHRENRRHKSPRALEHAVFTFDILADFGVYRDLQRHRMLTQERQFLTCDFGYYIPREILGTALEEEYIRAIEEAKKTYDIISRELPEEAQYVVPMAYNIHWYFHVNLRSLQWLCELRSSPQGHAGYRHIAQELARQVSEVIPEFKRFFKFVNFDDFGLGRLEQESRKVEKQQFVELVN